MKKYSTSNITALQRLTVIVISIAFAVVSLHFLQVYANSVNSSYATEDDGSIINDITDGRYVNNSVIQTGNKDAGSVNANMQMGRGIDLTRFGTSFRASAIVSKTMTPILDVKNNPCLSYHKDSAARQFTNLEWSDSKKEWGQKWGLGISASYNSQSPGVGKAARPIADYIGYQPSDNNGPTGPPVYKPDYVVNGTTESPAAAGGSAEFSTENESSWTTHKRNFEGTITNAVFNTEISYANGTIPSSDGDTCIEVPGISENQQLWQNASVEFKNDVLQKMNARQFLERWGNLVLMHGAFGSKTSIKFTFDAKHQAKSSSLNAKVSANYGGFSGGVQTSESERKVMQDDKASLKIESFGGYAPPAFDLSTFDSSKNQQIITAWYTNSTTAAKETGAFVGNPVNQSTPKGKLTNQEIESVGRYIWDFVDDKILAPEGINYPDAAACETRFADAELADKKAACLEVAGKRMTYQDYLHTTYRSILMERGSTIEGEFTPPPYVKDIYFGSGPSCALGSAGYCYRPARDKLNENMESGCQSSYGCIKYSAFDNNVQSANSGAYKNGGWSAWPSSIFIGYTLTMDKREALVSFDVASLNSGDAKNFRNDCVSSNNIPLYPINRNLCVDDVHNIDMNKNAGGDYIYLKNLQRYNPDMESYVSDDGEYHNMPLTAIGLQNNGDQHSKQAFTWPSSGDFASTAYEVDGSTKAFVEEVNKLSTGEMQTDNPTVWRKIYANLNKGAHGSGNSMYLWKGY